jgi:hypothetical protein
MRQPAEQTLLAIYREGRAVEWQRCLPVMCCRSIGMKHLALAVHFRSRSLKAKQAGSSSPQRNRGHIGIGQVRSGPKPLLFPPYYYCS